LLDKYLKYINESLEMGIRAEFEKEDVVSCTLLTLMLLFIIIGCHAGSLLHIIRFLLELKKISAPPKLPVPGPYHMYSRTPL